MTVHQQIPHPEDWMQSYGPALRRYFCRRTSASEVDDLVQEVFLKLQSARANAPIENVERYLFVVARNMVISQHRARMSRGFGLHVEYNDTIDYRDNLSPERIAIGKEEYSRVIKCILNLPPRARAAFQFHRFDNLTYQQIAERMCISTESVKELMHRALVSIAKEMESGE